MISSLRNVVKICYFSMWNILEKIPELSEHLWEKNMEQIAEGWFLDLQEFLEVWSSVKGGGNTKRRWLYMYPVFWFDEPKSVEVWKRKKTPEARGVAHTEPDSRRSRPKRCKTYQYFCILRANLWMEFLSDHGRYSSTPRAYIRRIIL